MEVDSLFIGGAIFGLVLGKIRGGRLRNLEYVNMKGWLFLILAILLQGAYLLIGDDSTLNQYGTYIYGLSFVFVMICLGMNRNKEGVWAIFLGTMMNLGGLFIDGIRVFRPFEVFPKGMLDTFMTGGNGVTLGDLWIVLGLILFIQGQMMNKFALRNRMIKFVYRK